MTATPATVVAAHGRHCLLAFPDGSECVAATRGRDADFAAGDQVLASRTSIDTGVIESRLQRRNALFRSDRFKRKTLAANVDQVAYVIAADPPHSDELLLRVQLAADFEGIGFVLVANKSDLTAQHVRLSPVLEQFRNQQVPVFELSARTADDPGLACWQQWLDGKTTVLAGQSGMGKSTLLNRIAPQANIRTQEISVRLQTGRHTTSLARRFVLTPTTAVIDTPGFQQFGLAHLSETQLRYGALEFKPEAQRCRFNNCRHIDEPGCAIRQRVDAGTIDARRYENYRRVIEEVIARTW